MSIIVKQQEREQHQRQQTHAEMLSDSLSPTQIKSAEYRYLNPETNIATAINTAGCDISQAISLINAVMDELDYVTDEHDGRDPSYTISTLSPFSISMLTPEHPKLITKHNLHLFN